MVRSLLPWWPKTWNPFSRWQAASHYDYETILSSLADEIKQVESTLTDIKARKRRAIHNVLQVMLTLWIVSLVVLWIVSSLFWSREWAMSRTILVISLLLGTPLFIAVLHRMVTAWFRRLERAQEQHLDALRKQQRTKINEIKRATDFDHLRALLDTYDTEAQPRANVNSSLATPAGQSQRLLARKSTSSLRHATPKETLRQHRRSDSLQEKLKVDNEDPLPSLAPAITGLPIQGVRDGQYNPHSRPSIHAPEPVPYHRSWMDKVADLILGTDPYGATLEDQQYALICRHCFRHNGLVPKNELNEIQYICPHCHAFNSRRPSSRPVSSPFAPAAPAIPTSEVTPPMERTITEESEPVSDATLETSLQHSERPPHNDDPVDEAMQLDE